MWRIQETAKYVKLVAVMKLLINAPDGAEQNSNTRETVSKTTPVDQLAALSPTQFGARFGRSASWAYRRIYAEQIKVIKPGGRIMIPCSEVETLLNDAHLYSGNN